MAKRRGNHEGSIYQNPTGTWRAQVSINGRRLSATRKTQKECRDWIKATIKQIDKGLTYDAAHTSYEEFISNWLVSTQSSLRPKTWQQYSQLASDYIIPKLGRIKLIELRPNHIQALYDYEIQAGRGLRTVQLIHAVIHRSLHHAVRLGLIGHNPDDATTPPKPKSQEMKIYDET